METSTTNTTLVAIFDDEATARQAREELVQAGFSSDRVRLTSNADLTSTAASGNAGLTGQAPSSGAGGGISGFFHRLFGSDVDEEEGTHYAEAVQRGSCAVTVSAEDNRIDEASEILNRFNPVDIDRRVSSWRESGYTGYNAAGTQRSTGERISENTQDFDETRNTGGRTSTGAGQDRSIPVAQEELQVGKRPVIRGGVRIHRRTIEQPVEQDVQLREETVRVNRRPANRPATEADFRPEDDVIEVTEMAEEAVIGKQARVVEEVVVGKDTTERTEKVRDNVRRTDVQVENVAGTATDAGTDTDYDTDFRNDFQSRYGNVQGATYQTYAPAYQYGYRMASDPQYRGRNWNDVQSDLETSYRRQYPNSTWEKMKDAVRYGWDKVTGKASGKR